jgi:hypothetical protein
MITGFNSTRHLSIVAALAQDPPILIYYYVDVNGQLLNTLIAHDIINGKRNDMTIF